jgi:RNA polymerase sigma-B factor
MTTPYDEGRAEDLLAQLTLLERYDPRWEEICSELVQMHIPLVGDIARRYARDGEPLENAEQAAFLGLVKAINGYDPEAGECFSAYASLTMIEEVKQYFREWL